MLTVVPRSSTLVRADGPAPALDQPAGNGEPRPDPLEVVENAGSNTRGRASGAIPRPSSSTASPPRPPRRAPGHAPRSRVASIFEQVDEDFLYFVAARGGERAGFARKLDRGAGLRAAQRVQVDHLACDTRVDVRRARGGSASAAGDAKRENARADASKPVDFGQDPPGRLRQRRRRSPGRRFSRARAAGAGCRGEADGVRGFLISCATCRAISPHASTRAARVRAVAFVEREPRSRPGAGARDASCTR